MEKSARDLVNAIRNESTAYTNYVSTIGNECAYTDSVIENIIRLAAQLANKTDNVDIIDRETTPSLLERFLRAEVKFRLDEIIDEKFDLTTEEIDVIADNIFTDHFDSLIDYDNLDEIIVKLAEECTGRGTSWPYVKRELAIRGYRFEELSDNAIRVFYRNSHEYTCITPCDDPRPGYYMIEGRVQNFKEWLERGV